MANNNTSSGQGSQAMANFKPAPIVRAMFNVGGLEDIPTGRVFKSIRGNTIIMGGYGHVNSICGGGNCSKSEQLLFRFGAVLGRYRSTKGINYDTENTMTYERQERVMHNYLHTRYYDAMEDSLLPADERKLTFIQAADVSGEEWFRWTRDLARERTKNRRSARPKNMVSLPIRDQYGNLVQIQEPIIELCDSLSMLTFSSVLDATVEKNDVGDKGNNTIFMKDGAAKTQMFLQLPGITTNGDIYMGMVAHIGTHIAMDQYAPTPGRLTFSKHGLKLKNVPEKFTFINNNVHETYSVSKLIHPTTKAPMYPLDESDKQSGNDLQQLNIMSTRNKSGPVGVEFNYATSQKAGIDPDLSRFLLIKAFGKPGYGMEGNDQNYTMVMLPNIKLSRTAIRRKMEDHYILRRAIGVCSEMLQMNLLWKMEDKYKLTPEELYTKVKERGYNWEDLLNTREHYVFVEDEPYEELPELNTWDFIRIAVGEYHPFWMTEIPKENKDRDALLEQRKEFADEIKKFEKLCPHLMR